MNVFFTTPHPGGKAHQKMIDAIVSTIKKQNKLTTPEDTKTYLASLGEFRKQGLNRNQAHYAFIRQGLASADVVIIEATAEDIRVGHEMTLALLFQKPTLVLAQGKDFSNYITHDLLVGASYKTKDEACEIVTEFLDTSQTSRANASMQTLDASADSLHSMALAKLRQLAKQEPGQFGEWARRADSDPDKVGEEIEATLGHIKVEPPWSVFAPVYNEDSPDYIQSGVAKFACEVLASYNVPMDSEVVEAACGTAALARQLTALGFSNITAFDNSRPMLAEAFRLSSNYKNIRLIEADLESIHLVAPVRAIIWTDYSSNFAMSETQMTRYIKTLAANLADGGILIFDLRTFQGWQIDFYAQPVTMFATERFQRIWINHQDNSKRTINFDVYIRTKDVDGAWSEWRRESMTERMWRKVEVEKIIGKVPGLKLEATYQDDFRKIREESEEPNLAYFVVRKVSE